MTNSGSRKNVAKFLPRIYLYIHKKNSHNSNSLESTFVKNINSYCKVHQSNIKSIVVIVRSVQSDAKNSGRFCNNNEIDTHI